jgi:hypothetical protein
VRIAFRSAVIGTAVLAVGAGIVVAGTPARGLLTPEAADILGRVSGRIDPATFPSITIEQDVIDWNHEITLSAARDIVLTLVENLEIENQAVMQNDAPLLEAVDHGDRLDEMRRQVSDANISGTKTIEHYQIDSINVRLLIPFGKQTGLSLGMQSKGTVTTERYDASGQLQSRTSEPFANTFSMRRATGSRWLNVGLLAFDAQG